MSDMMFHASLRFRFKAEYADEEAIIGVLEKAVGDKFADGGLVSRGYTSKRHNWLVNRVDGTDIWVADFMLCDSRYEEDESGVDFSVLEIVDAQTIATDIGLAGLIDLSGGRFYVYWWYNGCDMPITWRGSDNEV